MKIYKDKLHVKTISKKFEELDNSVVLDCFYQEKKRPTDYEKLNLEVELLKHNLDDCVIEIIKGKPFKGVEKVIYRNNTEGYVAIFGKIRVSCKEILYTLQNHKKEAYRNV